MILKSGTSLYKGSLSLSEGNADNATRLWTAGGKDGKHSGSKASRAVSQLLLAP